MAKSKPAAKSIKRSTVSAKTTTKVRTVSSSRSSIFGRNIKLKTPVGALMAEFIGTFLLAAIFVVGQGQPIILLFALAVIILMVGNLSGAHVNPAITFGAWITRRVTAIRALGYVAAQVLGAMLAYVTLTALLGGSPGTQDPLTGQVANAELFSKEGLISEGKEWYVFFAEMLGAAILGFGAAKALTERVNSFTTAYTISGALFIGLFIAGSTAILNPAVAITLQAVAWEVWPLAVYVFAPLVGVGIGFIVYQVLLSDVALVEKPRL